MKIKARDIVGRSGLLTHDFVEGQGQRRLTLTVERAALNADDANFPADSIGIIGDAVWIECIGDDPEDGVYQEWIPAEELVEFEEVPTH